MEPSKAAMVLAIEIYGDGFDQVRRFALELDRVDRVAREAVDEAKSAGNADKRGPRVANVLRAIMLPDPEPDPLHGVIEELRSSGSINPTVQETAGLLRAALTAAGYEIRKVSHD